MLNLNQKGCILAIHLLLFTTFIISYFTFGNAYAQLSPENQTLFDQSSREAQESLEQLKQKQSVLIDESHFMIEEEKPKHQIVIKAEFRRYFFW